MPPLVAQQMSPDLTRVSELPKRTRRVQAACRAAGHNRVLAKQTRKAPRPCTRDAQDEQTRFRRPAGTLAYPRAGRRRKAKATAQRRQSALAHEIAPVGQTGASRDCRR